MYQNKLIQIVRTFSVIEMRQWHEWMHSPVHNKHEKVKKLADILRNAHPDFKEKEMNREKLFKKIFPKEAFKMPKLRHVFSDTTLLTERFLVYKALDDDEHRRNLFLLQTYQERHLDKLFENTLLNMRKSMEEAPIRNADYFYKSFRLEELSNRYDAYMQNRSQRTTLQGLTDELDRFYMTTKLQYSCEQINRGNILSETYDTTFLDALVGYLENREAPAMSVEIFNTVKNTLTDSENETHYFRLKELLTDHGQLFTKAERRDLYAFAQNYAIKKINRGNPEYLKELLDLYQELLKDKTIYDGKYLSPWHFKNIVYVGLRQQRYDWIRDFIETYQHDLPPQFQRNAYIYNLAYFHFFQQDYKETLSLLNQVEFEDMYYYLDSRSLLLKTYYELDEIEPLQYLIDSFRAGLRRNQNISDYQRTIYNNLIKFVKKLVRVHPNDKDSLNKLKNEIEATRQIADITWLKTKIDQMLGVANE